MCRAMADCQTYFCGKKLPIAAEIDGAKLYTSQWVLVEFSNSNIKDQITQKANPNKGNETENVAKFLNVMGKV